MEYYSMWDYQSFDDEEDYYEDWWNYREDYYDDDSWSDSGYTSWEDRGWYDYTEEEWRQWYEENGWNYPTEGTTDVSNYTNDEPYVNDEYYNIRMVGGSGDPPREHQEKDHKREDLSFKQEILCTVMTKTLRNS